MNQPTHIGFYPNGTISVRDQDGNQMPELQGTGWMQMYFERLEGIGIDPTTIEFRAYINNYWVTIKPFKAPGGCWNYNIDKE